LEQIDKCLQKFLSLQNYEFTHKDLIISLAYNFPKINDHWYWIEGINVKEKLTLQQLLDPKNPTTFNYLQKSQKPYFFDNSKENAKANGHYMYDSIDETISNDSYTNKQPVGSIFCYKYEIKKNNGVDINAILSISTYRKRFVPDIKEKEKGTKKEYLYQLSVSNTRDNMIKIVEDQFGIRICIELCILYFSKLSKTL